MLHKNVAGSILLKYYGGYIIRYIIIYTYQVARSIVLTGVKIYIGGVKIK